MGRSREGVGDEETVDHTCYVKTQPAGIIAKILMTGRTSLRA